MSKIKMRCIACGKWFQSANAKEVTCPDCVQKARKEKQASKNTPPTSVKPAGTGGQYISRPPAPSKPKHVQSGTNQWLDKLDDVKVAQPDPGVPQQPKIPTPPPAQRDPFNGQSSFRGSIPTQGRSGPGYRDREHTERGSHPRSPAPYHVSGSVGAAPTIGQRPPFPRQPSEGGHSPGNYKPARPGGPRPASNAPRAGAPHPAKPKAKKAPAPSKPKREKVPPAPPFVPTPEQIKKVEERYLELSQPGEFDGIRTQIAHEESMPKKAVKKIIKDLRDRSDIPSWWELQTYKGTNEELEKIKLAYEPYLPIPPVGVHKTIADTLTLKPGIVYQAIKTIRQELSLPQYNDPAEHEIELTRLAQHHHKPAPEETSTNGAADVAASVPESTEVVQSVTNTSDGVHESV